MMNHEGMKRCTVYRGQRQSYRTMYRTHNSRQYRLLRFFMLPLPVCQLAAATKHDGTTRVAASTETDDLHST